MVAQNKQDLQKRNFTPHISQERQGFITACYSSVKMSWGLFSVLWPFLSVERNDAPLSLGEQFTLSLQQRRRAPGREQPGSRSVQLGGGKHTWALTVAPETALGTGSETLFPFLGTRFILCHQSPSFNTACVWRQRGKPAQLVASAPVRQRGHVALRFVVCPSHSGLFVGALLIDTVIVSATNVSATRSGVCSPFV